MNFKAVVLCLLIAFSSRLNAQSIVESIAKPGFTLSDSSVNKLAELAYNNITLKIANNDIEHSDVVVQRTIASWFNNIGANFNVNEYSIKNTLGQGQFYSYYPRYNISLSLPIGFLLTKGKEVKEAKLAKEKAVLIRDQQKAAVIQAFKLEYQNYQTTKLLLSLHETTMQDEKNIFDKVEVKFNNNLVDLEVYTAASKKYNDALIKKVNLHHDLINAEYKIETLLGMRIEDALVQISKKLLL